jgi:hypothetical protein
MRRLCFDTESEYYKSPTSGIGSVEDHRAYFGDKRFLFYCGVLYDESADKYFEFRRGEATKLIEMLKSADEIISHSGPRVDLIVLEHACGIESVAPIRLIKHHDLFDIGRWFSLDYLAKHYCPNCVSEWNANYERRWRQARAENEDSFVDEKLAKAHYDVERTYAVYKELLRRGELIVSSDKV